MAKPFELTPPKEFVPTEFAEQCIVFDWLKFCKLDGANLAFATLSGIRLPIGLAVKAKRAGMKQDVWDIFFPVPRPPHVGLWVEMKRTKGGRLSDGQRDWGEEMIARGYKVVVAKGAQQAISAITEYLR